MSHVWAGARGHAPGRVSRGSAAAQACWHGAFAEIRMVVGKRERTKWSSVYMIERAYVIEECLDVG